ncbi:TPA: restriction endonuclease subunit S [Vibrio parahaemolyticus]|nr:restriction endonuclease subunit S [Vibrio parahaemolyticus]
MEKLLDGIEVEWRVLGDIAEIYGGLTGKNKTDFENGNAIYIPYKNIFDNIDVNFDSVDTVKVSSSEKQNRVKYGDVLFTGSSEKAEEAGMSSSVTKDIEGDVYLNSFSFGVRFHQEIPLTPEFLKYLFRSHSMRKEIMKTASGVTRFNISKARFKKLRIPIPCLENPQESRAVQAEIVRILDTFTELTTELTTELSARKKQYNYYRDQLLSFEDCEVEWKTLAEIGEFIRGKRFTKKDYVTDGGVKVIHYGEIYTHYGTSASHAISQVRSDLAGSLRFAEPNDVIVSSVSETVEDVGKAVAWLGEDKVAIHDDSYAIRHSLNPKYLSYCLQTEDFAAQKVKYVSRGKVKRLLIDGASKVKIPIPYPSDPKKSRAEQDRIVAILDKFDTLTSSLREGLPREIELRQKQYEYYRDLLLSFPKPEVAEGV